MVFDLLILLLAVISLWPGRGRNGISTLLLRDGIGYFSAAALANGVQTLFAALGLSPVMNLFFLPFALVVSALAATTVFRNVLMAARVDTPMNGTAVSGTHTGASLPRFARLKRGAARVGAGSELSTRSEEPGFRGVPRLSAHASWTGGAYADIELDELEAKRAEALAAQQDASPDEDDAASLPAPLSASAPPASHRHRLSRMDPPVSHLS
jgi:hypothetical protein